MGTITIRELRQRWPVAEQRLEQEGELIVTRDGTPVAKLVRIEAPRRRRRRFDPADQLRWLKRMWRGRVVRWSESGLARDRADRGDPS